MTQATAGTHDAHEQPTPLRGAQPKADRERMSVADPELTRLGGAIRRFFKFRSPQILAAQAVVFGGARIAMLIREGKKPTLWDAAVPLAVMAYWPLQEWFLHYKVLHAKPRTILGIEIDLPPAKVHRHHHRHPWVLEHVFLPTSFLAAAVPVHVGLWMALAPSASMACTGIAAGSTMALAYEWLHFLTHTPYKPRSRYYRKVLTTHRLHHFRNEHFWHSFTWPWLDSWLGTGPEPKDVPRSTTCYTLGVEERGGVGERVAGEGERGGVGERVAGEGPTGTEEGAR